MTGRLERLRAVLIERELDAVLITHPSNRRYLSGYRGEDDPPNESAGVILVSCDDAILLVSPNNVEWATSEASAFSVRPWRRPWTDSVVDFAKGMGWRRLGFEEDAMVFSSYQALSTSLNGTVSLTPVDGAIDQLRSVKDDREIKTISQALALGDEIFAEVVADLKAGVTEREVAWAIDRRMRERGADSPAFPTSVASGPHSARPHHHVSDRPLQESEPIVIDMGARVDGYNGDLTRTIVLGNPADRLAEIYNAVSGAQSAALGTIRAGLSGKEADGLARAELERAGFGEYIVHGLGHGLGLRVHEAPSAGPLSKDTLASGQILTVEPGLYVPGWGGVRIEDVVLIEEEGCRVLTAAPKHSFH